MSSGLKKSIRRTKYRTLWALHFLSVAAILFLHERFRKLRLQKIAELKISAEETSFEKQGNYFPEISDASMEIVSAASMTL